MIHDRPVPARRTTKHLLVAPVLASFGAAAGAFVFAGGWRPVVWQGFFVSLLYSTLISMFAGRVMPVVVRRVAASLPLPIVLSLVFLGAAAATSLVVGAVALALPIHRTPEFWDWYFFLARATAFLALVSGFAGYAYDTLTAELHATKQHLSDKALALERASRQAVEARLSSLESRVQPHFLFNALNSVSALIPTDPVRAEDMLGRLADLLRGSLQLGGQSTTTLDRELAIVRDYLVIEQQRLGPRLTYGIDVSPEAARAMVPPFSVQILVENSIKHAIAPQEPGGRIMIRGWRAGDGLHVEVRDTGAGFDLSTIDPGHGLENLILRLEGAFGPDARLDVRRVDGETIVEMDVPQG